MRIRIFVEPQQGAAYDDILAAALTCESLGFEAFFRSDHFLRMGTTMSGLPGPTDAWTTLAGLARDTSRIRLGTLVSSATFRPPGILAIQVAQVDAMSHGRVELGLGTGWFEPEHRALGVPFPGRRFDALAEQLAVITGLWATPTGESFSYDGELYQVENSPALPRPVQTRVPIIVGGLGHRRTPALAAAYATEFNLPFPAGREVAAGFARADAACTAIGRDPSTLVHSVALVGLLGTDSREVARRAADIGRDPSELSRNAVSGVPDQARERVAHLSANGAEVLYLQIWNLHDLDHLALIAETLLPDGQVDRR